MKKSRSLDGAIAAPLLCLTVYLLLLATRLIPTDRVDSLPKLFFSLVVLELSVFALPAFAFCKLRGGDYFKRLPLAAFSMKKVGFLLSLTFFLLFGGLFINGVLYVLGLSDGAYVSGGSFILSEISFKTDFLYVVFAYAALPALCEEFLFRGVLFAEYRPYGVLPTLLISAFAYSFCFFDPAGVFSYLLTGLTLAFAVQVTGSVFAAMLMRFLVNLASIYLLPPLWNLTVQPLGTMFALCLSLFLLLLFLFFALKTGEKELFAMAADPARASDLLLPKRRKKALFVFLSPSFLACALLWLVTSILFLAL